ncbi:vWA domain-containing protein [Algibacter sp. L4_22]|uniref:vWA domain-containing protein n=1 Tax=Algibacter sp. L4_22 TaxID=2942477 RepID=UPI00201B7DF7|nr:vWA domain-containing protein [Algibacter sp. L4_22]MCL5127910.1 VWA domain-containing protein [Algibacter sp. L4_22]
MYKLFFILVSFISIFNCKNINKKEISKNEKPILVAANNKETNTKNAEIVFCLDATGSMGGLIGTAKEKIWDIVSELAKSNDIDTLKMGMVFYRDRGDNFITKLIAITADLDEAYSDLLEITANGGGDTPESVNQALNESITTMLWSTNPKTYKTIFVVGDCPPHMDYKDDILYSESCKKAAEKGIIINTIKLGNGCEEAIYHFKKMAECTNGEFLKLDQDATDYSIATPYDSEINNISKDIDASRIYYGTHQEREENYTKKAKSMEVYDKGSATANSSRAEYKNSKVGKKAAFGTQEIIKDYKSGKLKLDLIEDEKLPEELKGKSTIEKEYLIKDLINKRDTNDKKLKDLIEKKNAYIKSKKTNQKDTTSFSKEVYKIMDKQSKSQKSL